MDFGTTPTHCFETCLASLQLRDPDFCITRLPEPLLASDPVVDVTLDKEFFSNSAPQSKVHGFIMRLAQWNCGGWTLVC